MKAEEFYQKQADEPIPTGVNRRLIRYHFDDMIEFAEQYADEQSREEAVKFLLEMRHCAIPNGINKDEQRKMAYVFYDEWKSKH